MKVARVTWQKVRVPFVRSFSTAHGRLACREGLLLTLVADNGLIGWGEASPWPLFGHGGVADAARVVSAVAPRFIGLPVEDLPEALLNLNPAHPGAAAAWCGFDLAAHDLLGRIRGRTVAEMLGGARRRISVNAVIGGDAPEAAATAARAAMSAGFGCIKVKVAMGSVDDDEARVAAVRDAVGTGVLLRLDANGGWTRGVAIEAITRLERYNLDLIEQPVSADDLTGMGHVRRSVATPIAADEAVRDLADARRIIDADAADVLVVKPMVVGGLRTGRAILDLATAAGMGALVTTTIDFGIGVAGAMHLAACLPPSARSCGLATAGFLVSDLTSGQPRVHGGAMEITSVPGLGVTVDKVAVGRTYAAGPLIEIP